VSTTDSDATAGPVALVADDDGVTRRVLTLLLQRQGYRVVVAVDGEGALRLVRDARPDVVFLDARMPAPDGYEVCRTIRAEAPSDAQPYVTMITAAGQDDDRERAVGVGVDEFLTKPFSPSHLSARLRALRGGVNS
jgi:two-component system, OmpR family, phosphate regulon response regulator PhoB